jgi:hypothetical protein
MPSIKASVAAEKMRIAQSPFKPGSIKGSIVQRFHGDGIQFLPSFKLFHIGSPPKAGMTRQ